MRFNILINQLQCMRYDLNEKQGALMDLIGQLNTWADDETINGKLYYNLAYSKVITELPLFFKKEDTVYRSVRILEKRELIELEKVGSLKKNFIRLTPKGKLFFSVGKKSETECVTDLNPTRFGKKSETKEVFLTIDNQAISKSVSDLNPTNNNNNTNDKHKNEFGCDLLKKLAIYVGAFFGKTTEAQQIKVYGFLKKLENVEDFKVQFEFYKKYKMATGEKTHRFESYCTEWNEQNWELLLKNYILQQSNRNLDNNVIPIYRRKVTA